MALSRASFRSIQLIVGLDLHVLPLAIWNAAFVQVLQLTFLFFSCHLNELWTVSAGKRCVQAR